MIQDCFAKKLAVGNDLEHSTSKDWESERLLCYQGCVTKLLMLCLSML